ncbi:aldehyde oxidase 2-like [Rhinophrynus dorsalis]
MAEEQWGRTLVLQGDKSTWITPSCLTELLQLKSLYPMAPLVVGNTFIGPQIKLTGSYYPVIISPARVPELSVVSYTEKGITIGAACSLGMVRSILSEVVTQFPEEKNKIFRVLLQQLSGQQIKSEASLGGSILSGSVTWELNPILAVGNCTFNLASNERRRHVTLRELLFDEPGTPTLMPEELLISINVPFSKKREFVSAFRQVQRWESAAPAVVAAMRVILKDASDLILSMDIFYGGSETACLFAKKVSGQLVGRHWNEALLDDACKFILEEVPLQEATFFELADYERTLTISFLFKFYLQVLHEFKKKDNFLHNSIHDSPGTDYMIHNKKSAMEVLQQKTSNHFHVNHDEDLDPSYRSTNGNSVMHQAHMLQTIVEEECVEEDTSALQGTFFLALVTSTRHHAKIRSIHTEDALKVPGVIDVITASDVPGTNDPDLFAEDKVQYIGQVICAIAADTQAHANLGASRIRIDYEDLEPVLLSIQDSIKNNSFFEPTRRLEQGNIEEAFKSADNILEGEDYIGGQEDLQHRKQNLCVIPRGEDNVMEVFISTKDPAFIKATVASAVNIPTDFILCQEDQEEDLGVQYSRSANLAAVAAVAAYKTGQPVQLVLEHREDTSISRYQPPFLGKYKVGYMNDGKIVALDVTYYCNAGHRLDESSKVLAVSLLSAQNAYCIPNTRCSVAACKTNLQAKRFCNGYGFPQTGMLAEIWVDAVADRCNIPAEKVRKMNFHRVNSQTAFKQDFDSSNLLECWDDCLEKSSFHKRRATAKENNKQCPWKKNGLSIIPMMFPVGFIADFLNQASVLLHISTDGWVLISPAGNETEQETFTKMMQVASRELRIPMSSIHISETSTTIASNTSVTASSIGATVHAMAVQNACQTLIQRLQPIISLNPEATWSDCVQEAFRHRICLSAAGHYRSADTVLDWGLKEGIESPDFIFGAACSEVELDCRTGNHKSLRTDIVMDIGCNINHAENIEQIKKAFIQGLELFTREDLTYGMIGANNSEHEQSSQSEHVTVDKAPEQLNVTLLPSSLNPYMSCSPKGIEEASRFLGSSVFFAIKDAVLAARNQTGLPGTISLPIPARPQHVRLACGSHLMGTLQISDGEDCMDNHVSEN